MRNWGARLREDARFAGYRALVLENAELRVTLLTERGADVVEFLHKPTDTDFCTFSHRGLRPPAESAGRPFMDVYYGGWQEVFPSGGAPCRYADVDFDQHAEVALLPWRAQVLQDTPERVAVVLEARCLQTPLRLRREVALDAEGAVLEITSTAFNEGQAPFPVMWGQHLAFGAPYGGPDCRITLPPGARVVPTEGVLPLEALGTAPRVGETASVTYLTGFRDGVYSVRNPARPVGLEVRWDAAVLPYLWCWREAGSPGFPWYGREYFFGLEPFAGYPTDGLAAAVANGSALELPAGGTRTLRWSARVTA